MRRPVIVIAPTGGLCNRMQALDSAIALARQVGSRLWMHWYRSPNINSRFGDLFAVPDVIDGITELDLYRWSGRTRRRLYRGYHRVSFDDLLKQKRLPGDGPALEGLAAGRRLFIEAYRRFYEDGPLFADFRPAPRLQAEIDACAAAFGNTIGVHVRRTDNRYAIDHSPIELFIDAMRDEVHGDEDLDFFVATDSPEVEDTLRREFPGRIRTRDKRSLDRNDPAAIEDAVVDLYCLSRCRKLIGSHWSSFSETAWQLGGLPRLIVYRE